MSDLEQSDIEHSDVDEGSDDERPSHIKTSIQKTKSLSNTLMKTVDTNKQIGGGDEEDNEDNEDNDTDVVNETDESDDDSEDDDSIQSFGDDDNKVDIDSKLEHTNKKSSKIVDATMTKTSISIPMNFEKNDSDYESGSEEEDDNYLQKFDTEQRDNYILEQHPESIIHNYSEVYNLAKVQRNKDNIIIDDLHKTIPILTKYEKTRILGIRAKQINNGARPLVEINNQTMDGYLIALKELEEKKIPVIIRRPIPSGACEYWHLKDLEIL
jgi:DNA-directed RNA polymerase I, II, and III subunit RPABC2